MCFPGSSHDSFAHHKVRYMITEVNTPETFPEHSFAKQFGLYGFIKQYEIRALDYCSRAEGLYREKKKIDVLDQNGTHQIYVSVYIFEEDV